MTCYLYWAPLEKERTMLPDEIKYVLQKKENGAVDTVMGESDIGYLRGLSDAGIKGADEIIAAIQEHRTIVLYEE